MSASNTEWLVIFNPNAGHRGPSAREIESELLSRGVAFRIQHTRDVDEAADAIATAASDGCTRYVAVGGDGTVQMVIDAALDATPPGVSPLIGVIPTGSGRDFARTFGFSRSLGEAAARLADPQPYPIDIGVVTGTFGERRFVNVLDVGIAAASVPAAQRLPSALGAARYAMGFWGVLPRFPPRAVHVQLDRRSYEGPAINVVVANGQFFGGGMNIAPQASLVDGMFDVQVFTGPRRNALSLMPRVMKGLHLKHSDVRRFRSATFRIEVEVDWPVEADGELLGKGTVSGHVVPAAVRLAL